MRHRHALLACLALAVGCKRSEQAPSPSPSASAAAPKASAAPVVLRAPVAAGIPVEPAKIAAVVNRNNEPAWTGNPGTVRGLVTATGDRPPKQKLTDVPAGCERATEMYGTLFREGMMRSLADVLVTVTEYKGYVPAREDTVLLAASGCAWDRRTIAVTYGQRIDVVSKDKRSYMPQLLGGSKQAILLATPGGAPVPLYPSQPRAYQVVDAANEFMVSNLIVLRYSTHAVTRLDGHYEIGGIPPGEVKVTAFLPAIMGIVEKKVTVPAGGSLNVDFEIPFVAPPGGAAKPAPPTQRAGAKAPSPKP